MANQSNDYSYASAQSSTIAAAIGRLQLQDRGRSYWQRASADPSHAGSFRSQDRFLPDGTTDNINGGYWEFVPRDGIIDVEEFGLVGDGTTDNSAAMTALLSYVTLKRANVFSTWYGGGFRIRFPIGHFYFEDPIELKSSVIIEGQGSGMAHGVATKLRFATGGIVVNRYNTLDGNVEATPTTAADGTIIRNLLIATSATSGAHDGIWLRARATVEQVYVSGFPRHGIRIEAEGENAADPTLRGNANGWRVLNCRLEHNSDCGLFVSGGDVNAGIGIGIDAFANGNWGILDNSFLGNTYVGCHADMNGVPGHSAGGRSAPAVVSHGGRWYAVVPGQDSAASTTTPGTNAWIWFEFWPGETPVGVAAWSSGSTYKSGGPYALISDAATGALLEGCYSEGSQGPSFLGVKAVAINGTHGGGIGGHGCALRGSGVLESRRGFLTPTDRNGGSIAVGGDLPNGDILRIGHPTYSVATSRLMWKPEGDLSFNYNNGIDKEPFFLTGAATTTQFGSGAAQPHVFALDKLALGAGYIGEGGGRRITYRSAAPTGGAWARGDFVFNLNPSAGAAFGWRCTAAGTPGTWEAVTIGSGIADGDKGDIIVSGSGSAWAIDSDAVTNSKLANMAQATVKGRASGAGTGDPEDLSAAQLLTILGGSTGSGAIALAASPTFTGTVSVSGNVSASGRVYANAGGAFQGVAFAIGARLNQQLEIGTISATEAYLFAVDRGAAGTAGTDIQLSALCSSMVVKSSAGATRMTVGAAGADIVGEARCDSLRIDASATAAAVTQTHHVPISINGVTYKLLLAS